jgi:ABC-2 type transport system permease protein
MTAASATPSAFGASPAERAFLRLELADALRSRWVAFTAVVYTLVFGGFVWLGLRESSVLGFTGISRVVLNVSNAVVLAVPLVALVATCQAIVKARASGFFELFLAQPCRRTDWLAAVVASRVLVVAGPLVVLLFAALAYGRATGEPALGPLVLRSVAVVLALVVAFVGLGFFISSIARTPERATVYALVAWLFGAALHDFALVGALLRLRVPPAVVFALAAANPVEAARLAILSGVDPELSVLGPVGFWLANTLGPRLTLAAGLAWPAALGALALVFAARRLRRADLVG